MPTRIQQHHTYHLIRLSEMKKLFWERSFDSVAVNLVSIFIPIYLLKLHYSIQQIFWFYTLTGLFMTIIYPLGFKFIGKLGANRCIVLGNIANATFFLLLFKLPVWHEALWILAVYRGGYSAFYYPAFTANFVAARAHRKTGLQIGRMNAITLCLGGLAPAIGGFIASQAGISWVYVIVIISIVIANMPLLLGPENLKHTSFKLSNIPWESCKDFIANGLYNIPGFVESVIWPMAISLFITSYSGIGVLASAMVLSTIVISLYVGSREDRVGERQFINEGVATNAVANIGKLFASTPMGILGVNFVSGTSDALLANSFSSRYYKNADTEQMLEYTFGMEVTHSIIWTIYFGLLSMLAFLFSLKVMLLIAIALAIPSVFGVRLIKL
jgi:MFS family permease